MGLVLWLLPPALLALALVLASGLKRPILLRMALRNLGRRRAQALAIALGLMVGTAIISASLATGDSMTYAIRESAIAAFGQLDETVGTEGRLYFPESLAGQLERDPRVAGVTDGLEPLLLEDVAVTSAAAGLAEPRVALVGLDLARDARFGPYRAADGLHTAAGLGPGEAIVNQRLAEHLDARAGSTITVRYAQRPDLLIPRIFVFNGTLTAGAGAVLPAPGLPPAYVTSPLDAASFDVPVEEGAQRLTAALLWGSQGNRTDLDLGLQGPDDRAAAWNPNGTLGQPDSPAFLNASASVGTWRALVATKAAADQRFTLLVLVFYEVHDLAALQRFLDDVERAPMGEALVRDLTGELRLEQRNFTVRFVALEPGRGGFLNAPDVFVRLDTAQEMFAKPGRVNLLMVSNRGDEQSGLEGTEPAMRALQASLDDARSQPGGQDLEGVRPRALKQEVVQAAEEAGGLFSSFLTMMGSFSILAGLILIVNIFVMLTEERRAELGVARALGLARGDVTRLFLYEGAAYAAMASLAGALLGLAVSAGLVSAFNYAYQERIGIAIPFHPGPEALLLAFAAGVLMTLAAIALASHRAARLNIVRSIRRLEEPDTPLGRGALAGGTALLAVGALATLAGLASFPLLVLGPSAAIVGLALLAARRLPRSLAAKLAGTALFAYNLWTIFALDTPPSTEGVVLGPLRGVLLVVGAVLVLVNARALLRGATWLLARVRGVRAVARTALAYPLHKKLRTGLTVVMFGLVITVVVLFSIFFAIFTPDLASQSGGFEVRAESTLPVHDLAARLRDAQGQEPALQGVQDVASLPFAEVFGGRLVHVSGQRIEYRGPPVDDVYGFDEAFVRAQRFEHLEVLPRYASAEDAYRAVLRDPTLVVVSQLYTAGEDGRPGVHHAGETLTMRTRAGTLNLTIVAVQKQVYYGGVWLAKPVVEQQFDSLHGLHLLHVRPGADPRQVARAVERSQQELGMDAASVEEEAQRLLEQSRRLYALFEVYLGLGLVLGIASLGIITARSVLERRQEVGMLRAIGLPKRMVFWSFLLEGLFTVTLGAAIGLTIGVLVAWGVHQRSLQQLGIAFVVPGWDIAAILLAAYAATLAATLGPARAAARLQPAEAIRYIE
jgi:putative ABC transport system permease protein